MNIKKLMFLAALTLGTKIYADVADEISKYAKLVETICKPLPPAKESGKKGTKEYCDLLVKTGYHAAGISRNVEDFKNKNLATVSKKGDELIALLKCMDKGGMATETCKNLKCTSENDCIALIFKTTKELLEPILHDLIAKKEELKNPDGSVVIGKDGKPELRYQNGALMRLASLPFIPAKIQPSFAELRQKVGTFADNFGAGLDYLNTLSILLSPKIYLATTPQITPEEKKKIEEIPPLELPADTQIDPDLGLLEELV